MIRLGCALVVGMLMLIAFGCQGIYEGVKHGKQKVVTFEQFVKERPKEGWYKITGCRICVGYAAYSEKRGEIEEAYLPVLSAKGVPDGKAPVVLSTKNDAFIAQIRQSESSTSREADLERDFPKRDVEGMIQSGLHAGSERNKVAELTGMSQHLESSFVMLDDGRKPNLMGSIGMVIGGLLLGAVIVLYLANRNK